MTVTTETSPLALIRGTALAQNWRWRARNGELYAPVEMETRHLFHTLRMIWNNFMPRHMHVGQRIQFYTFQPRFYPPWYLAEAIVQCWDELQKRDDITPQWQREIDEMRRWFIAPQEALEEQHPVLLAPLPHG